MKTATRTVLEATTERAPPVRPGGRTAGKNENNRIVHVTDEFRGRQPLPPRPCNFRRVPLSSGLEQLRRQLSQEPDGKPDNVGDAPLQSFNERRPKRLNRITAGAPFPLPEAHVAHLFLVRQLLEDHCRLLHPHPLLAI